MRERPTPSLPKCQQSKAARGLYSGSTLLESNLTESHLGRVPALRRRWDGRGGQNYAAPGGDPMGRPDRGREAGTV